LEPHIRCAPTPGGVAAKDKPGNVWFVGALPKVPTGKILMREIGRS
jgi:hypothetical protein